MHGGQPQQLMHTQPKQPMPHATHMATCRMLPALTTNHNKIGVYTHANTRTNTRLAHTHRP